MRSTAPHLHVVTEAKAHSADEVRPESEVRASRIRSLLQVRDKANAEIAKESQAELDAVGEAAWLAWNLREFGWSRRSAYRHLDPDGAAKAAEDMQKRREANVPTVGTSAPEDEDDDAPDVDWDDIFAKAKQRQDEAKARDEAYAQREQEAEQELDVLKDAARAIVAAGFRALAQTQHPDKGGNAEQMNNTVQARKMMLRLIDHAEDIALLHLPA